MAEKAAQSTNILPASLDDCIELYFECETPDERDGFVRLFSERQEEAATSFLRAMMVEDEDEFVRLSAAVALAKRGDPDAARLLDESLDVSADDALLEAAIAASVECKAQAAAPALAAMFLDEERATGERRLAQLGLTRADPERAAEIFVDLLEKATMVASELIEGMMPALIDAPLACRQRATRALEQRILLIDQKRRQLEKGISAVPEGDEKEEALDKVDEAREAWERLSSCATSLSSELTPQTT